MKIWAELGEQLETQLFQILKCSNVRNGGTFALLFVAYLPSWPLEIKGFISSLIGPDRLAFGLTFGGFYWKLGPRTFCVFVREVEIRIFKFILAFM